MEKKLALIGVITVSIILFAVCDMIAVRVLLVLAAVFGVVCRRGMTCHEKYIFKKFPSTINSLTRNYDVLILGRCEIAEKCSGESMLDLTSYCRNLMTDRLILERYYGYLHKQGTVRAYFDLGNAAYINGKRIAMFDIPALHEVTLWEHGIDTRSREYKALRYLIGGLFFFYSKTPANLLRHSVRTRGLSQTELTAVSEQIQSMIAFCVERGIKIDFHLCHGVGADVEYLKKVIAHLSQ